MARRLVPLLDRVLIEKIVAPTKSAGGVLLPESALPKVCLGDSSRATAEQIDPRGQPTSEKRAFPAETASHIPIISRGLLASC